MWYNVQFLHPNPYSGPPMICHMIYIMSCLTIGRVAVPLNFPQALLTSIALQQFPDRSPCQCDQYASHLEAR